MHSTAPGCSTRCIQYTYTIHNLATSHNSRWSSQMDKLCFVSRFFFGVGVVVAFSVCVILSHADNEKLVNRTRQKIQQPSRKILLHLSFPWAFNLFITFNLLARSHSERMENIPPFLEVNKNSTAEKRKKI